MGRRSGRRPRGGCLALAVAAHGHGRRDGREKLARGGRRRPEWRPKWIRAGMGCKPWHGRRRRRRRPVGERRQWRLVRAARLAPVRRTPGRSAPGVPRLQLYAAIAAGDRRGAQPRRGLRRLGCAIRDRRACFARDWRRLRPPHRAGRRAAGCDCRAVQQFLERVHRAADPSEGVLFAAASPVA